jgi:DNA-binding response OmpR family regulator
LTDSSLSFLRDMTVLLAEDDVSLRELMTGTLGLFFRDVLPAEDGGRALELFEAHRPHMAILDINMPGLSGLEVAEAIREVDADLPIMILTGHDDAAYMQTAVRLRLMNYLLKPLSLSSLKAALKGCLEEMKRRDRLEVPLAGGTLLNPTTGTAVRGGQIHRLTRNELRFLEILLDHRGVIVEPVRICLHMSVEKDFTPQALRNLVWRLRDKIGAEAIFSARDKGYMVR